jgi:hypothetical protein
LTPRENVNVVDKPENVAVVKELADELYRTIALPLFFL